MKKEDKGGENGKLRFSEKTEKEYRKKITSRKPGIENAWGHMTEANMVKGSDENIARKKIAIKSMKPRMATGPFLKYMRICYLLAEK